MNWILATSALPCGSCREIIRKGAAVLLVTEHNKPRCRSCAKTTFNVDPPDHWPVPEPREAPTYQPFVTPAGFASTFRDGKLAQLPEQDR